MKLIPRRRKQEDSGEEKPASFAAQCEHVCTPKGRTAHLRHPDFGILCGWHAPEWRKAGPPFQECQTCKGILREIAQAAAS